MRHVTAGRILAAVLVATLNVIIPTQASVALAGVPSVSPTATEDSSTSTFCVEGLYSFYVEAYGLPGEVQTFDVTTDPLGFVRFALTTAGPFSDRLSVPVTIGVNGAGATQFIARGTAVGSTTLSAENVTTGDPTNTLPITIDQVKAIDLEPADLHPGHLEPDPRLPEAGALRAFPDMDTPGDDSAVSRRFTVKATLESGSDGVTVEFRWADVDDPSTDTSPADPNGPAALDNRGQAALSALRALSDMGVATVDLSLPMQPGDNLKVVASCAQGYVNGLSVSGASVMDAQGRTLPTPAAQLSPLVTTWRRLWIETDSMGLVVDNFVEGTVSSASEKTVRIDGVRTQVTQLKLGSMNDAAGNPLDRLPKDQFLKGRIEIGGSSFEVLGSVRNLVYIPAGHAGLTGTYAMVDDDNLSGKPATQLDGDDGFDVPRPDMADLQPVDSAAANWFADAFIRPIELLGHDDVPFYLQATDDPGDMFCRIKSVPCPVSSFDNIATEASSAYWTVYLLGAYQAGQNVDGDPEAETPFGGMRDDGGLGAAVYAETIRDEFAGFGATCEAAGIAVHEVAHMFVGEAHSTGIMAANCVDGSASFSPESLNLIRSALHP